MKRIRQFARGLVERGADVVDRFITRYNQGQRPRRGIGTAGPKVNKDLYKCGGKHK